jgi:protein-glutamine gamma-glutamyltransferase
VPPIDPRLQALSDELSRGGTDAQGKALRLERELKRRYAYTLDLPGDVRDPLADFLFQRKAGHCEDFATALAVMLRLQGIPSRVTTGFFGGTRSGERYTVRAGDAHAWVEAFVDGRWTRFDATPESGRLGAPPAFLSWVAITYEAVEEWWRVRVMDYSIRDQLSFARSLVAPPSAPRADPTPSDESASSDSTWPRWALAITVLLLAFAAAWTLKRRRRPHPATDFLREIERRLERAGIAEATTLPLEELSSQLTSSGHPLGPALAEACRRYLAARFGAQALAVEERARLLALLESPRRPG